jgi:hypothetical protein
MMTMILLRNTSNVALVVGAFLIARPLMKCRKTDNKAKKTALGGEEPVTYAWTAFVNGTRELRNQ